MIIQLLFSTFIISRERKSINDRKGISTQAGVVQYLLVFTRDANAKFCLKLDLDPKKCVHEQAYVNDK